MIRTLIRTRTSSNNNRINGNQGSNNGPGTNNDQSANNDHGNGSNNNNNHGNNKNNNNNNGIVEGSNLATGPVIEFNGGSNGGGRVSKPVVGSTFVGTSGSNNDFPDVDGLVKGEFVSKKVIGNKIPLSLSFTSG